MGIISLGSNIAAVRAQRQLGASSDRLSATLQRLSSGQRINRASDDAAGLAISSSLNKDVRVFTQAVRNANDAISALNISQGSLNELSGVAIRIRELATQSANGTFSRTQRLSLDAEGEELAREFNRVIASSSFNGLNLLSGRLGELGIQLGYGAQGSIGVQFGNGLARKIGTGIGATTEHYSTVSDTGWVGHGDFNGDGRIDLAVADSSSGEVSIELNNGDGTFTTLTSLGGGGTAVNAVGDFDGDGLSDIAVADTSGFLTIYTAGNNFGISSQIAISSAVASIRVADLNSDGRDDIVIDDGGSSISTYLGHSNGTLSGAGTLSFALSGFELMDMNYDGFTDIVSYSGTTLGVRFGSGDGSFSSSAVSTTVAGGILGIALGDFDFDGFTDIAVDRLAQKSVMAGRGNGTFGNASTYAVTGSGNVIAADTDGDGILDIVSAVDGSYGVAKGRGDGSFESFQNSDHYGEAIGFNVADLNGDGVNDIFSSGTGQKVTISITNTTNSGSTQRYDLTTRESALAALGAIEQTFQRLQRELGNIGSSQSRILSAINAVAAMGQNSAAAAGRIKDADIAFETANLMREQILQQSAAQVLANATRLPDLALKLLAS